MIKIRTVRVITALIVILVTLLGAACKTGYGTICSLGAGRISFTCPLGFLQMALAARKQELSARLEQMQGGRKVLGAYGSGSTR